MKKFLFLLVVILSSTSAFSQIRLKLSYPKCEVVNQNIYNDIKKHKTFTIESEADFSEYFKLTEGEAINFEKNMVLAGLIGTGNDNKFIKINAASYDTKAKLLNVRFDIDDAKAEDNGKFCVVVVPKSFSFKKVSFLKGKLYNMSQSGE